MAATDPLVKVYARCGIESCVIIRWNMFCRSWGRVSAFITLACCRCSRKQLRFSSPKDSLRSAPYCTLH